MASEAELERILARDQRREAWDLWGPYLSRTPMGNGREDYSADGDAWLLSARSCARSRVYRWGEDGMLGICDSDCRICFLSRFLERPRPDSQGALFWAFESTGKSWRGREGIFLPPRQHAVSQPDARALQVRPPQEEFPYRRLIEENARRSRLEPEFELVDTGVFNDGRYFDIFIDYTKAAPNDISIRICAINRGPDPAPLTILPTLWFRNTWSWGQEGISKPEMHLAGDNSVTVTPWGLPVYHYCCDEASEFVFTENETNDRRLFASENQAAHVKDAFHDYIIHGKSDAVNPAGSGTKASPCRRQSRPERLPWSVSGLPSLRNRSHSVPRTKQCFRTAKGKPMTFIRPSRPD